MISHTLVFTMINLGCGSDQTFLVERTIEEIVIEKVIEENVTTITYDADLIVQSKIIESPMWDFAFIIDSSCSMSDNYDVFSVAMPLVYESLSDSDILSLSNWQALVRATDEEQTLGWVDYTSDNSASVMTSWTIDLMNDQGINEIGLDSVIYSIIHDIDFHRNDANLGVVFISDEPDSSYHNIKEYESIISMFKSDPNYVSESAITALMDISSGGCEGKIGEGYIDVSEILIDICASSGWEDSVLRYEDSISNDLTVHYLDEIPYDPQDLLWVFIDEQEINDWSYNHWMNAVTLDEIPEIGSHLLIIYGVEPSDTNSSR